MAQPARSGAARRKSPPHTLWPRASSCGARHHRRNSSREVRAPRSVTMISSWSLSVTRGFMTLPLVRTYSSRSCRESHETTRVRDDFDMVSVGHDQAQFLACQRAGAGHRGKEFRTSANGIDGFVAVDVPDFDLDGHLNLRWLVGGYWHAHPFGSTELYELFSVDPIFLMCDSFGHDGH